MHVEMKDDEMAPNEDMEYKIKLNESSELDFKNGKTPFTKNINASL